LWGKLKYVAYLNNPYDLEALKQNINEQFTTFSNMNCNKFSKICLKEFRHFSQEKAGILNIYDGEYNINYYI
jgi:hypothetical protein